LKNNVSRHRRRDDKPADQYPGLAQKPGRFSRTLVRRKSHRFPAAYLKSEGRRSVRLHFSHSATFFTLPFSNKVFILISPPQEQKNFWVELDVRAFLLAWAIPISSQLIWPDGPALLQNTTDRLSLSRRGKFSRRRVFMRIFPP
jgi:hypothetical protein